MNWWMRVLQTLALPLGHVTIFGVNISTPFGAADEARTRYLHLGKVALYQMSYGRILITLFALSGPRKSLRSKGLWGEGENLVFITEVLLARLPDE